MNQFKAILEHYTPIESIPDSTISYGSLANGKWGYLFFDIDGNYEHSDDPKDIQKKFTNHLKDILKQMEKEQQQPKQQMEDEMPW